MSFKLYQLDLDGKIINLEYQIFNMQTIPLRYTIVT